MAKQGGTGEPWHERNAEGLMRTPVADVLHSARIMRFYLILEAISLFTQYPLFLLIWRTFMEDLTSDK